jgi:hypothetical protein
MEADRLRAAEMIKMTAAMSRTGEDIGRALASQAEVALELTAEKRRTRRQFRAVLTFLAVSVVALMTATLVGQSRRADEADARVALLGRQVECRTRIADTADALKDEADAILRKALVDYATAGRPTGLVERATKVDELNYRIDLASELRSRRIAICAENPDYTPP